MALALPAVGQDIGGGRPGLFEAVGQDWEPVERPLVVDGGDPGVNWHSASVLARLGRLLSRGTARTMVRSSTPKDGDGMRTLPVPGRTRRRARLLAAALGLLLAYVGTYVYLSRRGMAEARAIGFEFFFYCPVSDLRRYEDLPVQHGLAVAVFDPVNRVDRAWFGGGTPCRGVSWGFSR